MSRTRHYSNAKGITNEERANIRSLVEACMIQSSVLPKLEAKLFQLEDKGFDVKPHRAVYNNLIKNVSNQDYAKTNRENPPFNGGFIIPDWDNNIPANFQGIQEEYKSQQVQL